MIGEQPLIELALHLLRKRRPIAAHDLHADEFDLPPLRAADAGPHSACSRRAVLCLRARQEQLQVEFFEFAVRAGSPPANGRLDMPREFRVQ